MHKHGTLYARGLGFQTLIGSHGKYPREFGNCFSVWVRDFGEHRYLRIVNFILENLEELQRRGLTWPIRIREVDNEHATICDERILDEWYRDDYCEVCTPHPLLPATQRDRHVRAMLRGDREESDGIITGYIGGRNPDRQEITLKSRLKE